MSHEGGPENPEPMKTEPDRTVQPVGREGPPRLPFVVVGVGASAGGLEAFTEFLSAVPADSGMAFVLVQHLAPDRESMVAQILQRKTPLTVYEVEDNMPLKPNHVYVIRPGHVLRIHDGALHLGERVEKPQHNRPVDDFFRSLAEEQRERSVGIILSGMGSNGTAGAQAIKVVGGLCIAQDPDTAIQASMPRSLINAGYSDFVMRPAEMPEFLMRYAQHPYVRGESVEETNDRQVQQSIVEIINILRLKTKRDFSPYKRPTVQRRILRRMGLNRIEQFGEYAKLLRRSPTEATALADDLMIHVTGFFRDPEAWETLRQKIVTPLVAQSTPGADIRCWVSACSSGEEAYTLAMLLTEAAEAAEKHFNVKVFATDTAQRTLMYARSGLYPGGIETEIAPARLERFFERDDSLYRIKRELREMVVFAPQNVVEAPPFSRLDIVTCRNLLIYLEPEVQRRILTMLHFGLRENGALFLGSSETITGCEDLFEPLDRKWRIYKRVGNGRSAQLPLTIPRTVPRPATAIHPAEAYASLGQITQRAMLARHTPASVVVDREFKIIYFHGNTTPFLTQPDGEPTSDLLSVVHVEMRGAVRSALMYATRHKGFGTARDGVIDTVAGRRRVEITVEPLDFGSPGGNLLVNFNLRVEPAFLEPADTDDEAPPVNLVSELQRTRDELQSAVEELQSSNEELQASNEEVMSVNEELQSSNEELETSKEEMQSLNEELSTVNSQLHAKNDELERTNNDLASLLSSTSIAVIFLDTAFRIRRFTPAMRDLLDVLPSDIGRPLKDLNQKFTDPALLSDAAAVLDKLIPREVEIRSDRGLFYLRRVLPYRTIENRIDGVVITFVDITEAKRSEDELKEAKQSAEHANTTKDRFLAMLSHELRTPLTPIALALSESLADPAMTGRMRETIEMIRRNLAIETRLIDDLLDLSRVMSGKLRITRGAVHLHDVLQHAVRIVSNDAKTKDLTLDVKLDAANDTVSGDDARLHQVFVNLLGNAIKFTPARGKIHVRTRNAPGQIEVEVSDSGAGIAPELIARIFEPFEQGNAPGSRKGGGLGLGLAITRTIVEMHDGEITARSDGAGRGAAFAVSLPLLTGGDTTLADSKAKGSQRQSQSDNASQSAASSAFAPRNILVVEDNRDTANVMHRILVHFGHHVRTTDSVAGALKLAEQEHPEILISDISLADGSGHDLMKALNRRRPTRGIAVSGLGQEQDIRRSEDAGFHEHLTKPVDIEALKGALQRLFSE